jgi:hypothetical protein
MKFEQDRDRLICIVNLAQAFKWLGDKEKCLETLSKQDWTATNIDFRLIVSVLKDDFDGAAKLMKQMGDGGEIGQADYLEWPVFKEFRNSSQFLGAYKQVFKTEVEVRNMPADVNTFLAKVPTEEVSPSRKKKKKRKVQGESNKEFTA